MTENVPAPPIRTGIWAAVPMHVLRLFTIYLNARKS